MTQSTPEGRPPGPPEPPLHLQDQSFLERNHIHPIVFAVSVLLIVFFLYQIVAGGVTFLIVGTDIVSPENAGTVRALTMAGQILFILLPTLLFARALSRRTANVFRWRVPSGAETFFGIVSLLFLQQVLQIYLFFQDRIPWPETIQHLLEPLRQMVDELYRSLLTAQSVPDLVTVLLVAAVVPAVVEELFFRGLIQSSFAKVMTPLWAAVVAGVIFGLYHLNPFEALPLMGLGVFFGILRMRSDSILMPMTTHFVNNALAVLALYFKMDETMIVGAPPAGEPNITAVLVQLVLYLALFGTAFYAYLRSTAHLIPPEEGSAR